MNSGIVAQSKPGHGWNGWMSAAHLGEGRCRRRSLHCQIRDQGLKEEAINNQNEIASAVIVGLVEK